MEVAIDIRKATYTGLMFQLEGTEDWDAPKKEAVRYIKEFIGKRKLGNPSFDVLKIDMPCGNSLKFRTYKEIRQLPIEDVPCPCGNQNHWLIRFIRNNNA